LAHPDLRLLAVMAHPDDESLGVGGSLARYSREGVGTYLVTGTRGERGRYGDAKESPGPGVVGREREAECRAAARVLGVREVSFLGYMDGDLDRADPAEAAGRIAAHIRRIRPHVVMTFGPEGAYGHPDHVAICQFTTAAVLLAAGPAPDGREHPPHAVSKLYYMASTAESFGFYESVFKKLRLTVDGVPREGVPYPEWMITTVVDTAQSWPTVWEAVQCHRTQLTIYGKLAGLTEAEHRRLWGIQQFYRVLSLVNGGRSRETDLFEGLR
jgi:LmbE family N-acetylglucosaminyl deacetylase